MVALSVSVRALILFAAALTVKIQRPVEDYAQLFSKVQKDIIAERIDKLGLKTSAQLAVLTVSSLEGQKIETFARRTAVAWGGGRRHSNDGLLLILAIKERKIRLEVGPGLVSRLPSARVQEILDEETDALKRRDYSYAVLNIITAVERTLRFGNLLNRSAAPVAVAVGAAAAAKGVQAVTRDSSSPSRSTAAPPAARPTTPPLSPGLAPPVTPTEDASTRDSRLMQRFFLLLSIVSLVLGLVLGHWRLRQDQLTSGIFSYTILLGGSVAMGFLLPWIADSSGFSLAAPVVAFVQAFSAMRAMSATQLRRHIGPDDDVELVDRASTREAAQFVLPGVGMTLLLGVLLFFPFVRDAQTVALVGSILIGVVHAFGLNKLDELVASRPLPEAGTGLRICTSPLGRTDANGAHVHDPVNIDNDPPPPDPGANERMDGTGNGGTFNGDGATSSW